jgi:hypothetical protein
LFCASTNAYVVGKHNATNAYVWDLCLFVFVFGPGTTFITTHLCLVKWEQTRLYSILFGVKEVTNAYLFTVGRTNAIVFVAKDQRDEIRRLFFHHLSPYVCHI